MLANLYWWFVVCSLECRATGPVVAMPPQAMVLDNKRKVFGSRPAPATKVAKADIAAGTPSTGVPSGCSTPDRVSISSAASSSSFSEGSPNVTLQLPASNPAVQAVLEELEAIHASGGTVVSWLENKMSTLGVGEWVHKLDEVFPPKPDTSYATKEDLDRPGFLNLRLQQLAWHTDAGNAGVIVKEDMQMLVMLILQNGFLTDPTANQGVEALASKRPDQEMCEANAWQEPYVLQGRRFANALGVFHVKGWRRTLAAQFVATVLAEDKGGTDLVHYLPPEKVATFCTVCTVMKVYSSLHDSIMSSRLMTLAATSTRRAPNCFNQLHQLRKLQRAGIDHDTDVAAWMNKTGIMKAFKIGPAEAQATLNLSHLPRGFTNRMQRLVEKHGFTSTRSPLTHTALASPLLALGAGPAMKSMNWTAGLKNDEYSLHWLGVRIEQDYEATPKSLRRPLNVQTMMEKQQFAS